MLNRLKPLLPVLLPVAIALGGVLAFAGSAHAQAVPIPSVNIGLSGSQNPQDTSATLQVIALLTILAQALMGLVFGLLGLLTAVPILAVVIVAVKLLYVEDVLGETIESGTAVG